MLTSDIAIGIHSYIQHHDLLIQFRFMVVNERKEPIAARVNGKILKNSPREALHMVAKFR